MEEHMKELGQQELLHSLQHQATRYRMEGRYRNAEALYERSLLLSTQVFGPDTLETAKVLNNIGILYKCMGRFSDAWRLYRRALFIIRRIGSVDDAELASLYHNLGGLEHACGRYARGEIFTRRAVAMREKALGS
jgi:tetratricopeptide (TPR) repeat protein